MKSHRQLTGKYLVFSLAVLMVLALGQSSARADEVTFTGSSRGEVIGIPLLTFAGNGSFTGTTALGVGALSGTNSLGTFFLSTSSPGTPVQSVSGTFAITLLFPPTGSGMTGNQTVTLLVGGITGSSSSNLNQGGVRIHFTAPGAHIVIFGGDFLLLVPDVFVQSGQSANLTAQIFALQDVAVPEPATLLLLGTGIAGIAAKLRRRRKVETEAKE